MEITLPGTPWLIAHKSMLGINKPNKITLNGDDYVLWQNQKGEVFGLSNVCPHMQAPLSQGWVCQQRDTITCPFHALEFDGQGRLYKDGKIDSAKPIAQPLNLIVNGNFIWTYTDHNPKIPVPEMAEKIAANYDFVGIAGSKTIQADWLSSFLINCDYNHQNGTHRELFQIIENKVTAYEKDKYHIRVEQETIRKDNTLGELFANPALLSIPKVLKSTVEYEFPSILALYGQSPLGEFVQLVSMYPETQQQTKIFEIVFVKYKRFNFLKGLMASSMLKVITKVVEQDTSAVESLYSQQQPKIKLPNEEIMFDMIKLFHDW
ncbi:Rieske (2Fe-2S) protein [Westiellopsis prolifica IICB1]|nr:Rieske (2Fe-2S) protein [Westiellopsis prolifica IICB1]